MLLHIVFGDTLTSNDMSGNLSFIFGRSVICKPFKYVDQ